MSTPLPTHIGGYQHLEPWVIAREDDIRVRDGKPICFVGLLAAGKSVGSIEAVYGHNVYRLMPVAKQSDAHERDYPSAGLTPRQQAEANLSSVTGLNASLCRKLVDAGINSPAAFEGVEPRDLTELGFDAMETKIVCACFAIAMHCEGAPSPTLLPSDPKKRKGIPLYSGVVAYFPDALCAMAELSRIGNDQHNPGKPLHWDRSKSGDEEDALMRHLIEGEAVDKDGVLHAVKCAWRACARAQKIIERKRNK